MPFDELRRQVGLDGHLRVITVTSGALCEEAARRHGVSGALAVALGRTGTCALLLAASASKSLGKEDSGEHRLSLQLRGGDTAAIEGLTGDALPGGGVRMYATTRAAIPQGAGSWMSIGGLFLSGGNARVGVVRDLGLRQRYTGEAALVSGEIDEDVEHYLMISEQVDSATGCDVQLGEGGRPVAAAGILAQALPGAGPEVAVALGELRTRLRSGALARALEAGEPDLAAALLPDLALTTLETRPVAFRCPCSRERVLNMLRLLGPQELGEMMASGKPAEITCNFCCERYEVATEELASLRDA